MSFVKQIGFIMLFYSLLKGALYILVMAIAWLLILAMACLVSYVFCFIVAFSFNKLKQCFKSEGVQNNLPVIGD